MLAPRLAGGGSQESGARSQEPGICGSSPGVGSNTVLVSAGVLVCL